MKKSLYAMVVGLFLFGIGFIVAQSAFTTGSVCRWDPVTKNINGGDTVIKSYELAIVPITTNLNTAGTTASALMSYGPSAWTGLTITPLVVNFPEGPGRLQARAISAADIPSAWSVPLDGTVVKSTAPNAPAGLKAFIPN